MNLIAITNQPATAVAYERIGIDRILVDLERLGKAERQHGKGAWLSDHVPEDIGRLRAVLTAATLMVRVNPDNASSATEIDVAIAAGADVLMLPMARTEAEVARFVERVAGRAKTCLLLETADALARAKQIVAIDDLDEIHVGLNDLHLTLGMRCMFEILADGLLDGLANEVAVRGKVLGIGGVGALGRADIDPKLILREHIRLGSKMVILSRAFFAGFGSASTTERIDAVAHRVVELRDYLAVTRNLPAPIIAENRRALQDNVARYLASKGGRALPVTT